MLKKTLLSVAITAAASSAAFAGQLQYATTETGTVSCSTIPAGNDITNCGVVTFADEMFGPDSTTTKANLQDIAYVYQAAHDGAQLVAGDTVKLSVTNTSAIYSNNLTASQFAIGDLAVGTGFTLQNNANVLSLQLDAAGAAKLNSAAVLNNFVGATSIDANNGAPTAAGVDPELQRLGITTAGTYFVNNLTAAEAATAGSADAIIGATANTNDVVQLVVTGTAGSLAIASFIDSGQATVALAEAAALVAGTVQFNFRSLDSNTNLPGGLTNVTGSLARAGSGFDTETQKFVTLSAQVDAASADARDQAQPQFIVQQSTQAVTVQTRAIDTAFLKAINVGEGSSSVLFSDLTTEFASDAASARFNAIGALRVDVRDNTRNEDALNDFGLNADDEVGIQLSSVAGFNGLSHAVLVDLGGLANLTVSTDADVKAACQGLDISDLNGASNNNIVLGINSGDTELNLNVSNSQVERNFAVCLVADTTNTVDEITVNGDALIDYSNVRYLDSDPTSAEFVTLFKNGCIASVHNLPKPQSADDFFVRLTNTSSTTDGAVQAYMYTQDGTRVPATGSLTLVSNLRAHETAAINASTVDAAFGGGNTSLTNGADGVVTWDGRSRLVMRGEFQTCEALGLVRTNGVLTNNTATTQGNDTRVDAGNNGN